MIFKDTLIWYPEYGIGRISSSHELKSDYFDEYSEKSGSEIGKALTKLRINLVKKYLDTEKKIVDIGIGDGSFLRGYGPRCKGYDIDPKSNAYLIDSGRKWMLNPVEGMTFWDSIEHIFDPVVYFNACKYAFISTPIYENLDHLLESKHYKPAEHCWYFTYEGINKYLDHYGFESVEDNIDECQWREDIGTFVFEKKAL